MVKHGPAHPVEPLDHTGPELNAEPTPTGDVSVPSAKSGLVPPWLLGMSVTLGGYLLTLFLVSLATFLVMGLTAGDVAVAALGREASLDQLEAFRERVGLNDPILVQYWNWLTQFVSGDWGVDPVIGTPVADLVLTPFGYTLALAVASLIIAVPVSMGLGMWSATRIGTGTDRSVLTASIVIAATPEFVLAVIAVLLLGVWLGWFPVDSTGLARATSLLQVVQSMALPVIVLAVALIAYFYRVSRAACHEVLESSFVEAARLRGMSTQRILLKYVLRNASPPLINAVAIGAVHLIGGVILVEQVFGYPGLGQGLVQAIAAGSTNAVQAMVMLLAASFLIIGALSDLVVKWLNRPVSG